MNKKINSWEFPDGPVTRTQCFHSWGLGLIHGWETKIPTSHVGLDLRTYVYLLSLSHFAGFPGGLDGKESVCNAGGQGLIPGLRRSPGEGIAAAAKSLQSCPTLCHPIDGSPLGYPVPGILQARTLEWVAISFSKA